MAIIVTDKYTVNTTTGQYTDLTVPEIEYKITREGLHLLNKGTPVRKIMMRGFIVRKQYSTDVHVQGVHPHPYFCRQHSGPIGYAIHKVK